MRGITFALNAATGEVRVTKRSTDKQTRIPTRLLARELSAEDVAKVAGGGKQAPGTMRGYTKTVAHGEMGDYVSP